MNILYIAGTCLVKLNFRWSNWALKPRQVVGGMEGLGLLEPSAPEGTKSSEDLGPSYRFVKGVSTFIVFGYPVKTDARLRLPFLCSCGRSELIIVCFLLHDNMSTCCLSFHSGSWLSSFQCTVFFMKFTRLKNICQFYRNNTLYFSTRTLF